MAMQYISHSDAAERSARVQIIRQGIEEYSKSESSICLTRLTSDVDKSKEHVFTYHEPEDARISSHQEDSAPYKIHMIRNNNENDTESSFSTHSTSFAPNLVSTGFRIGPSSEGRVSWNQSQGKSQRRHPHSWKRKLTTRSSTIATSEVDISSASPFQMTMKQKPALPLFLPDKKI